MDLYWSDPGEKILPHIIARVPYPSPWPIEYARRAKLRGDGPTLVLHKTGGVVRGQLLVLDMKKIALDELIEWLWEREGKPARERLKQMRAATSVVCFIVIWSPISEMKKSMPNHWQGLLSRAFKRIPRETP